ncbi:hypothetical protein J0676_25540, partial [Vibrio sp. Vb2880]|uniref:hypothetical protein n=1 Tax=Vibrio sp. Vb2880 TaxID=2816076 RepID=UPI001A8CBAD5
LGFCFGNALKGIEFIGYVTAITASRFWPSSINIRDVKPVLRDINRMDNRILTECFLFCGTSNACLKLASTLVKRRRDIPLFLKSKKNVE